MAHILSDDEVKQMRIADFERGALQALNWKISAGLLKRSADVVLKQCQAARSDPDRPQLFIEGQEEQYDFPQLIHTYYFLMGLAIENLATGIVMNIHPEYLKKDKYGNPEKLINIKTHNSNDLLLTGGLYGFESYKDLLDRLCEYVVWIGRYPVPLELMAALPKINKEGNIEWKEMPQNALQQIEELYYKLYKRLTIESRLRYLKNDHILSESFNFRQFMETTSQIVRFMEPEKGPKQNITKTIQKLSLHEKLVTEALRVYIYYLPKDDPQKRRLESKFDQYELGREDKD